MTKAPRALRTDGEATYNRILEAAGELFAAAGFAETTSKAIAARAGADMASINYHFRSRGGLYEAVLIEAHARLISIERLQALTATDLPARDRLRRIIEELVENATADRGWHARVLAREILAPSSHLPTLLQGAVIVKLPIVLGVLSEITAIPADAPALLRCLISVLAPCAMLLVIGRDASPWADDIRAMPRAELVEHLYRFAIGGMEAVATARPRD